ncbi:MAG: DUF115 domain-containing protein [Spirochaetales bacterium]|jgi:hypothetical protein|nr:DUF115 domain-containing protein [Spirochaetales bacterium]
MSFLEKNLAALEAMGCDVSQIQKECEQLIPAPARDGHVTATRDGLYIHSRFSPEKEAARLVESLRASGLDTVVIYGFGLGYHIEAFFAAYPQGRAIVVEPDAAFLHAALKLRDFTSVFHQKDLRLLIAAEPQRIVQCLHEYEDESFQVLRLRSVYTRNEGYYKETDAVLSRLASRRDINLNTLRRFGRLWVRNLARNIPLIITSPGISRLEGKFAGFPVLVAAAGPSLDEALPYLTEIKKRCLLVAVDTSYSACLRAGEEPDFVVVVDPQYWNTRHLDRARQQRAILVSESSTHPRIFRQLPGKTFLGGSIFPLGRYLEEAAGSKGKLGAGGSVSTSAWDFSRLMGGSPIIMAGLDLGFPSKNTHYKGSFFENRAFFLADRLAPGETQSCRYLYDASPRLVPDNSGGMVLSDMRMLIYIWWFEIQTKRFPGAVTLTLSRGGARAEGVRSADIDSVLALPERRSEIDSVLASARAYAAPPANARRFQAALDTLLEELTRLEALCAEGLRRTAAILRRGSSASPAALAALTDIDRKILGLEYRDIAGFLLADTLQSIAAQEAKADMRTALSNAEKIYAALKESARYHREILQKAGRVSEQAGQQHLPPL